MFVSGSGASGDDDPGRDIHLIDNQRPKPKGPCLTRAEGPKQSLRPGWVSRPPVPRWPASGRASLPQCCLTLRFEPGNQNRPLASCRTSVKPLLRS